MAKHTIILDKSYLLQNVCRTILVNPSHFVEAATYLEDIDVLLREQKFDNIILGESAYIEEEWNLLVARNPSIKGMKKIFINEADTTPQGFSLLKRPFKPFELFDILEISHPLDPEELIKHTTDTPFNDRRVFQRNIIETNVYFDDEFGKPITYLAAKDVSLGGLFLEGSIPLQVGALAFLSFELNGERISTTGQVVRRPTGGIGIRFLGLSKEAESIINKFLG